MVKRREDLGSPRAARRLDVHYDPDAFGRFSESIARFLGTARFLVFQTVVIILWIAANLVPPSRFQFDPWGRGLVLLTLVLSLQASYAAPLILLAQNRQERRGQTQSESDREVAASTQAETEFLARGLAGVRLMLADVVTGDELRDELKSLTASVERIATRLEELDATSRPQSQSPAATPASERQRTAVSTAAGTDPDRLRAATERTRSTSSDENSPGWTSEQK